MHSLLFLPRRGSIWMPIGVGVFLAALGVLLALLDGLGAVSVSAGVSILVYSLAAWR